MTKIVDDLQTPAGQTYRNLAVAQRQLMAALEYAREAAQPDIEALIARALDAIDTAQMLASNQIWPPKGKE